MAQISLRVEDDVKTKAERVCSEIGLSMSAAINVYLKKIARENRIPFELSADPFYSEENTSVIKKRINDVMTGKAVLHEHDLIEAEQ